MKCSFCGGPIPEYGAIILTIDGDMACSKKCEKEYKKERDNFLNNIIHDDDLFSKWLCEDVDELCKKETMILLTQE